MSSYWKGAPVPKSAGNTILTRALIWLNYSQGKSACPVTDPDLGFPKQSKSQQLGLFGQK
jgi:hypothetical protein